MPYYFLFICIYLPAHSFNLSLQYIPPNISLTLRSIFILMSYCPTASRERLGRSNGEYQGYILYSLWIRIFNENFLVVILRRRAIPKVPPLSAFSKPYYLILTRRPDKVQPMSTNNEDYGIQIGSCTSHVHGLTILWEPLTVSGNVLLKNITQGKERLQITAGIIYLLILTGQITAQEAAAAVLLVLTTQRGLRNCTS